MPAEMYDRLRKSVPSRPLLSEPRLYDERIPTKGKFFIFKRYAHQPMPETLRILDETLQAPKSASLLEVHIALDLITNTHEDALELHKYVEERFWPSTRLRTLAEYNEDETRFNKNTEKGVEVTLDSTPKPQTFTTYFNKATRKGDEIKLYSDKVSKVTGQPCLHIEWRIVGAVELRRANLGTVQQIVDLNIREFCKSRIDLRKPPSASSLAKLRNKRRGSPSSVDDGTINDLVAANKLLDKARGKHGVVVGHNLLQLLRKAEAEFVLRPDRKFSPEPNCWMLPPANNCLW